MLRMPRKTRQPGGYRTKRARAFRFSHIRSIAPHANRVRGDASFVIAPWTENYYPSRRPLLRLASKRADSRVSSSEMKEETAEGRVEEETVGAPPSIEPGCLLPRESCGSLHTRKILIRSFLVLRLGDYSQVCPNHTLFYVVPMVLLARIVCDPISSVGLTYNDCHSLAFSLPTRPFWMHVCRDISSVLSRTSVIVTPCRIVLGLQSMKPLSHSCFDVLSGRPHPILSSVIVWLCGGCRASFALFFYELRHCHHFRRRRRCYGISAKAASLL